MATDLIAQQKRHTLQDATRQENAVGVGLLFWLAQAGQIIAPWWSKRRDEQLRTFWKDSAHFSGAMYMIAAKLTSIPFKVEPRDMTVRSHVKAADTFNTLLDEAPQFGAGWADFWTRFYLDLWGSDNGAFGEVIGAGNPAGPIQGPPLGLAHLDSYNCQRTSDPEFPVIYTDSAGDGKRYKLHYTRVIYASQLPSTASEMHGVGLCWLSRAINSVQNLIDVAVYKQEKLGSRPLRSILVGQNVSTNSILSAIAMAEEGMDNQGLSRYAKTAVLGDENQDISLDLIDLVGLPDGFDERIATDLAMYTVALTGGFPPRWLWPASTTGATKADAMYQHVAGSGGGLSWHLSLMQRLLGGSPRGLRHSTGKFLPPFLKLVFDYQDDEQDRLQGEVKKARSDTRDTDLKAGVIDIRTAREQALAAGDLTAAQFERLELEDGRLETGDDVLTVFSKPEFDELLDLGVEDPLLIDANDPLDMLVRIESAALDAQDTLAVAGTAKERQRAQRAISALGKLKDIYSQLVVEDIQAEQAAEAQEDEERAAELRERAQEQEEKAADFDTDADGLEAEIGGSTEQKSVYSLSQPAICGKTRPFANWLKQDEDEPPRGDFEDEMADDLAPVFAQAEREALAALEAGDEPDYDELRQRLITLMVPLLASAAVFAFNQGEEQFQLFFDDGDVQAQALEWAQGRAETLADQLLNTTRNIVDQAQQQADEGATDSEVRSTVERAFSDERRERIGITETTTALAFGLFLYWLLAGRQGVELEEIWYTRLDERVCPVCAPLHGTTKDEWGAQFPDGPPAHVRCRCGKTLRKKRKR